MYWERRLDDNIETAHYRRTFGDILIHLEPPCFCDIEDKLSLLVSIPSPVLEQISLDTFIFFWKNAGFSDVCVSLLLPRRPLGIKQREGQA